MFLIFSIMKYLVESLIRLRRKNHQFLREKANQKNSRKQLIISQYQMIAVQRTKGSCIEMVSLSVVDLFELHRVTYLLSVLNDE